ncbi:MAG: bifunctional demethylmenaquinone methyltransferase/2-methoxy-6-polyprenyl-1,4-benzoquinol methylase UbiE [Bacteroidales bacterium]
MASLKRRLNKDSGTISGMFNEIAPSYDFLNHLLSFNIDKYWRSLMVNFLLKHGSTINGEVPLKVLDIACGTGDSTIALYKKGFNVTGIDIAEKMMEVAIKKNKKIVQKSPLIHLPIYILGSAEALPFPESSFDAVTISFGIRNFNNRAQCLADILRVIKPNGVLAILEFAKPKNKIIRFIYNAYFNNILPFIGNIVSKDKGAYKYLAESVEQFPKYDYFCNEIKRAGFKDVGYKKYTFGIAVLYTGKK